MQTYVKDFHCSRNSFVSSQFSEIAHIYHLHEEKAEHSNDEPGSIVSFILMKIEEEIPKHRTEQTPVNGSNFIESFSSMFAVYPKCERGH